MRKTALFLLLLAVFLTPILQVFAQDRPNIPDLLDNDSDGRFTTLMAAVDAAGMRGLLEGDGPFTVLAPTNDAFTALLDQTGMTQDDLLANTTALKQILLQHIVPGRYLFRNLTSGPTLPSLLVGQSVSFDLTSGVFTANGANISDVDNLASNGVVQVVDAVILPPSVEATMMAAAPTEAPTTEPTAEVVAGVPAALPDLPTLLANDGQFTTFLAAVDAAGLNGLLAGDGPFTLLAPSDDAFTALLDQTGMTQADLLANTQLLKQVILQHVIPGRYLFRDLTSGPTLPSLLVGQSISFDLTSGVFTANGANIGDVDNLASNGVMFVVDSVILPPSAQAALAPAEPTPEPTPEVVAGVPAALPDLPTLLANDGQFTTFLAAVDAAGLNGLLAGDGPFTLLAPSDDAFTALLDQTGMTQADLLANTQLLKQVILQHVIPGRYLFRDLTSGPTLPSLLVGQSVSFDLTSGVFTANGANIGDVDNIASNGVMFVVDSVILPPSAQAALVPAEPTPEPTVAPTEAPVVAGVPAARPSLLEVLQNDPDGQFTMLLGALQVAGLTQDLATGGPYTVLAPTNDAFTAAADSMGMSPADIMANPSILTQILQYHIVPGRYFFRNLTSGPTLPTLLQDESVTFDLTAGVFTVQGANISGIDKLASNGIVFTLDSVMVPPSVQAMLAPAATPEPTAEPTVEATPVAGVPAERPDLLTALANDPDGQFSMLLAAIDAAGLSGTLNGDGPYTLLAPNNDAFTAAMQSMGSSPADVMANPQVLKQILLYHIIPGRYLFRDLTSGPTLPTTLVGQKVTFDLTGGVFTAQGVNISDVDNLASNGVYFVLDGVMIPPSLQAALMPAEATAAPTTAHWRFAQFAADVASADLTVDGASSDISGVAFASISDWMSVEPGTYEVSADTASVSVDVAEGDWVTLALTGSAGANSLMITPIYEMTTPLAEGSARLSVFDSIEGTDYDVLVDGQARVVRLSYPGTRNGNDGYYALDLAAGTYSIQFTLSGRPGDVVVSLPSVSLDAGKNTFIAPAGTPTAPGVTIVTTDAP